MGREVEPTRLRIHAATSRGEAEKAIDPEMDYFELEGISEGMAASDGYLEAVNPTTSLQRKAELEGQLLLYCRFDTEAMVKIVRFLTS